MWLDRNRDGKVLPRSMRAGEANEDLRGPVQRKMKPDSHVCSSSPDHRCAQSGGPDLFGLVHGF